MDIYKNSCYWKYTQTQARIQSPRPRGSKKIWLNLKGPPSNFDFNIFFYIWDNTIMDDKHDTFFAEDREGENIVTD